MAAKKKRKKNNGTQVARRSLKPENKYDLKINEIKEGVLNICRACKAEEAFELFTQKDFRLFEAMLIPPIQVHMTGKCALTTKRSMIATTKSCLSTKKLSYIDDGPLVMLWDHFIYGITLSILLNTEVPELSLENQDALREQLHPFYDYAVINQKQHSALHWVTNFLSGYYTESNVGFMESKTELLTQLRRSPHFNGQYVNLPLYRLTFNFKSFSPTALKLRRGTRNAYPVCFVGPINDLRFVTLNMFDRKGEPIVVPFYIGTHAIERLKERLDGVPSIYIHNCIRDSIYSAHERYKDKLWKKRQIPLCIQDVKVGYLVISNHKQKFYIHTFLFITNKGTPEGNRLFESLGIRIEESKYFKLGRLSTYTNSDVFEIDELKYILRGCRCEELQKLAPIVYGHSKDKNLVASKLSQHLHMDDEYAEVETYYTH